MSVLAYFAIVGYSEDSASIAVAVIQVAVFAIKLFMMNFVFIWVRWTLVRFRYDQLQALGWKVLLPLSIFNILITSLAVVTLGV
jgi:NADH-quinone oxidoreductase subunit H